MPCVFASVTVAVCFSYAPLKGCKPPAKCCASPTICSVANPVYRACAALEAAILAPVLRPIFAQSELGDFGLGVLARGIAESDRQGFAAVLAARLQRGS